MTILKSIKKHRATKDNNNKKVKQGITITTLTWQLIISLSYPQVCPQVPWIIII